MIINFKDGDSHEIVELGDGEQMLKEVEILVEIIINKCNKEDPKIFVEQLQQEIAYLINNLPFEDVKVLLGSTLVKIAHSQLITRNM